MVRDATDEFGFLGFLITNHGCQFCKVFGWAVDGMGIRHVHGLVRKPCFNEKAERSFHIARLDARGVVADRPGRDAAGAG